MKFSERLGYKPVKEQLSIENIDDDLKNSLWSYFFDSFLNKLPNKYDEIPNLFQYCSALWLEFFKLPIDTSPIRGSFLVHKESLVKFVRDFFFNNKNWYDVYDLLEFSIKYADKNYVTIINQILEREKSAFRFINKQLIPVTSQTEIDSIEESINKSSNFNSVNIHINSALNLLADKKKPDYRNSIKESISAVESMCKTFTNDEKSTLGDVLVKLEKDGVIHPAFKRAFSALYGYTSDDAGIRHALVEGDRIIDFHEAKFMLVTCTSFINFLTSKIR